ncbi:MAG: hypothetical protein WCF84_08540 [Anaerolineae bacterium]
MKLLASCLIIALLLESISYLLPSRLVPHDHLLVGNVTAEQLHSHLTKEAQELDSPGNFFADARSAAMSMTATGGRIISIMPSADGFLLTLHPELALQLAVILFIGAVSFALALPRIRLQTRVLASVDPPPRPLPLFA